MSSGTFFSVDQANPINWTNPLNLGTVAWWLPLPGNSGGAKFFNIVANKEVNHPSHGTLIATGNDPKWLPSQGASGTSGGNVSFPTLNYDGSTNYITLTPDSQIKGLTTWTLLAWVYPTVLGVSYKGIYASGSTLGLFITPARKISYISGTDHAGATSVLTSVWSQIVYAVDKNANTAKGYLNGKQDYSASLNLPLPSNASTIGAIPGGSLKLTGQIGEVRIWNRALTADQIFGLYNLYPHGYSGLLNRIREKYYLVPPQQGGVTRRMRTLAGVGL